MICKDVLVRLQLWPRGVVAGKVKASKRIDYEIDLTVSSYLSHTLFKMIRMGENIKKKKIHQKRFRTRSGPSRGKIRIIHDQMHSILRDLHKATLKNTIKLAGTKVDGVNMICTFI